MYQKTTTRNNGYSSAYFSKRETTVKHVIEEDHDSIECAYILLGIGLERQNKSLVEGAIDSLCANGQFEYITDCIDEYIAENFFDNFIIEVLKSIADNKKYGMNLELLWAYGKAITQGERITIPPKEWGQKNPNRVQSTTQQYIYFAL